MINHVISLKIHTYLLEYDLLFWMITWMKNVNNCQITKVQSQGVA